MILGGLGYLVNWGGFRVTPIPVINLFLGPSMFGWYYKHNFIFFQNTLGPVDFQANTAPLHAKVKPRNKKYQYTERNSVVKKKKNILHVHRK